jgi:hypothetical protein
MQSERSEVLMVRDCFEIAVTGVYLAMEQKTTLRLEALLRKDFRLQFC